MKAQFPNIKFFCLTGIVILALSHATRAQQQKIGYVNTDTILEYIPEYNGIDQQLRLLSQQWRSKLDSMQQELDQLKEDFSAKEILYTDEIRQQKQEEIRQEEEARQQYLEEKFGANGEYYQEQKSLLQPIQRKVFNAINTVAERNGYDYVFDRSGNTSMLYFRDEWNLNDEVLQELGISENEISN